MLNRFFPISVVKLEKARYLDVILYSKAQIDKETVAMGKVPTKDLEYEYGIVSVKSQDVDYEITMNPITMMRNALGTEHGGSGVPLDKKAYMASVAFWSQYALAQ